MALPKMEAGRTPKLADSDLYESALHVARARLLSLGESPSPVERLEHEYRVGGPVMSNHEGDEPGRAKRRRRRARR
jgi:hypothetical protein